MLIVGAFDDFGNATIKIRVSGPLGTREYAAIVDTGFSGFVALPQAEMVPLGLAIEPAVASVMLGNGDIIYNLVATGTVTLGGQTEAGSILLDETTTDFLVGMALLRTFKLALILTDERIVLHDRSETLEALSEFIAAAPAGLPDAEPGDF